LLTADDRWEIQDLYTRYMVAFDIRDLVTVVGSFALNGVFVDPDGVAHSGREEIQSFMASRFSLRDSEFVTSQHWIVNLLVEGDKESAHGFCYMQRIGNLRESGQLRSIQGAYQDQLIRVAHRWRFSRRKISYAPPGARTVANLLAPGPRPELG
jgi:ketosteroid isomerase-like protein